MKNCAVLIDMENLVGGYAFKYLRGLSLRRIFEELKERGYQEIAVKRAYADWSHPNFNSIRWEIVELGIEPVQMYGFSKGAHKNASDIHLAIDAMELLYTRPFIENFIIVSGDGGFGTLVKKLGEHGKKIIGVAYEEVANPVFKNVCDEFISIENALTPEERELIEEKLAQIQELAEQKRVALLQNPILEGAISKLERKSQYNWEEIKELSIKALNLISQTPRGKEALIRGMNISTFKLLLDYLFENFNFRRWGFARYPDFLKALFCGTPYKLVLKEPSDYRILQLEGTLPGYKDLECSEEKTLYSAEGYITLLKEKSFPPPRELSIEEAFELLSSPEIVAQLEDREGLKPELIPVKRWQTILRKSGIVDDFGFLLISDPEEGKRRIKNYIEEILRAEIGDPNPFLLREVLEIYISPSPATPPSPTQSPEG
jgi:uncharacterized LabA/DUF88 family protein